MDFQVRITNVKILFIKIYYDKNNLNLHNIDTHPINAELEALRQLTHPGSDTKMSEENRLDYANFANFFKRILHRKKKLVEKATITHQNIEALKTELTEMESLRERDWLNDKLDELMEEIKGMFRNMVYTF